MSGITFTGSFDLETFIDTYPTGSTDTLHLWISASYSGSVERWFVRGVTISSQYQQQDKYMDVIFKQAQRVGIFLPNPVPPPPTPTPTPSSTPTPPPTPTPSPTPTVYTEFNDIAEAANTNIACLNYPGILTLYGNSNAFNTSTVFFTDSLGTQVFVGQQRYYSDGTTWHRINNGGFSLSSGQC